MVKANPSWHYLLANPIALFGFGFGSGLAPIMPGTVGTLAAVPIYLALAQLPLLGYLLAVMVALVAGIYICGHTARELGVHDHGGIVWDEFVGLWITLIAAPAGVTWLILGFILFRLFDMVKPWPISMIDRTVGGGWGIMLDDIVAGLAAAALLQACYFVFKLYGG